MNDHHACERARAKIEREQLQARDVADQAVLDAMGTVPREAFVPNDARAFAYADDPLPIGFDATISQPYIVGLMLQAANIQPGDRVLDVGAGSGYQTAVLAQMGAHVFGIECVPELARMAHERVQALGLGAKASVVAGDGRLGLPAHAPFQAILVAACADEVPPALLEQLAPGGRLVLPVGRGADQSLWVVTKDERGKLQQQNLGGVRFVPLQ